MTYAINVIHGTFFLNVKKIALRYEMRFSLKYALC